MQWLLLGFITVTGILNTIQAGSNVTLTKATQSPVWSVVAVFAVALGSSLLVALVSGQRLPAGAALGQVPWWAWIGGVFGALYILSMLLVADKIGAALFTAVTVTAAILTSLAMDHFGLLGFDVHPAGWGRLAGGALMVGGLILIALY